MKIEYVAKDLLEADLFVLHGCNAQGVMGSGVAKAIRDTYPEAFWQYKERHERSPLKLGEIIMVDCGRHVIMNGITQEFYGKDGKRYVDYDAVKSVIIEADKLISIYRRKKIMEETGNDVAAKMDERHPDTLPELALPAIGAGLGGGDWAVIAQIVEENTMFCRPVVYTKTEQFMKDLLSLVKKKA